MSKEIDNKDTELRPFLTLLEEKRKMDIPDGYFTLLQSEILAKVKEKSIDSSRTEKIRLPTFRISPFSLSAAASVLLIIVAFFYLEYHQNKINLLDLEYEILIDYVIEDIRNIDMELLSDFEEYAGEQEIFNLEDDDLNYYFEKNLESINPHIFDQELFK